MFVTFQLIHSQEHEIFIQIGYRSEIHPPLPTISSFLKEKKKNKQHTLEITTVTIQLVIRAIWYS